MKRRIPLSLLCVAALAASAAQAQSTVYRWVDKDGKVQFTDMPPPSDARSVTERRIGGGTVDEGQVPFATQVAARRHPVLLYVGDDCGDYCKEGRALLGKRGIPYTEKNAQRNPADADELRKAIGALEVPVLLVGTNIVKGFSEESWHSALDQAGYARTRLPGQPGPRPADAAEAAPK
jgi:glutaredoxin